MICPSCTTSSRGSSRSILPSGDDGGKLGDPGSTGVRRAAAMDITEWCPTACPAAHRIRPLTGIPGYDARDQDTPGEDTIQGEVMSGTDLALALGVGSAHGLASTSSVCATDMP